jgi:hypothetical protein
VAVRAGTGTSRESFEALARAVTVSGMRPVVDHVFPAARLKDALAALGRGEHFGKLVVDLGSAVA